MMSLRMRMQQLVTDTPEELVLEEAERLLRYYGERNLQDSIRLTDVAFLCAALVLVMKRTEPVIHEVVLSDGVKTSDG